MGVSVWAGKRGQGARGGPLCRVTGVLCENWEMGQGAKIALSGKVMSLEQGAR